MLWEALPRPEGGGLGGAFRQRAWDALAPALDRQAEFNALVVQILNGTLAEARPACTRACATSSPALVRYLQRVQPLMDARDRWPPPSPPPAPS